MNRRHTGLLVRIVLAGVFLLAGWQMVAAGTSTAAQRQQESAQRISDYTPTCDGKTMRPRDTCLVFGGSGDEGGSYQTMVDRYTRQNSPEKLAGRDRAWRTTGSAALLLGGLALLYFVLSLIEVIRYGADEPQAAIAPYQTRFFIFVVTGVTAVLGWGTAFTDGGTGAWIAGIGGTLICLISGAGFVSSVRTRIGRKRWAKRRGYTFEHSNPTLAQRLGWSQSQPSAGAVVSGTYRDRAFYVFDFTEKDNRHTALVLALPGDVPSLSVQPKDKVGARLTGGTDPHWADHGPQVVAAADKHYPWAFMANGRSVWAKYDEFLSPSGASLDRRLDGLHKVGTDLVALTPPRT
ncbi:hypothetical protein AB0J72_40675 [Dactylosporangium sp. NPDC049742]|uniref:hypothetical protein n=1 Tax=Dactylosporangium sp. NPDC049742 TaxID=3154737 RepID=UPI0034332BE4